MDEMGLRVRTSPNISLRLVFYFEPPKWWDALVAVVMLYDWLCCKVQFLLWDLGFC